MIPFSADIHTRLAAEIAPALQDHFQAQIHIATVFNPDTPSALREEKINEIKELIENNSLSAKVESIVDRDVLNGILKKSRNFDLVLMGGRTGDFLELLLAKSLAQEITEQVRSPVLWVKEYEERESFWSSLFKSYKNVGEEEHA
ncbi:MAG: universal stress protein [Calditrichia bacterium]